jgi:hypothetical protein
MSETQQGRGMRGRATTLFCYVGHGRNDPRVFCSLISRPTAEVGTRAGRPARALH